MKVVEYWHGTIKNYRYDGDVSPRHHVMIGCDKLYVHIQRVQASFAHAEILGLNLTSLAYADMASEH